LIDPEPSRLASAQILIEGLAASEEVLFREYRFNMIVRLLNSHNYTIRYFTSLALANFGDIRALPFIDSAIQREHAEEIKRFLMKARTHLHDRSRLLPPQN
jgi:hypothetical protein